MNSKWVLIIQNLFSIGGKIVLPEISLSLIYYIGMYRELILI